MFLNKIIKYNHLKQSRTFISSTHFVPGVSGINDPLCSVQCSVEHLIKALILSGPCTFILSQSSLISCRLSILLLLPSIPN